MSGHISKAVLEGIATILEEKGQACKPLQDHQLRDDLGFASLDFAQLVAMLELSLGVDPFTTHASPGTIHTVNDLIEIYGEACIPVS